MGVIIGLSIVLFFMLVVTIVAFVISGKVDYRSEMLYKASEEEAINKIEVLKRANFYFIGRFILERNLFLSGNKEKSKTYAKIVDSYEQLYGNLNAQVLTKIHYYRGVTIGYACVMVTLLFALITYIDYHYNQPLPPKTVDQIERPEYGEQPEQHFYSVTVEGSDESREVIYYVNPKEPTEDEAKQALTTIIEEYDDYFDRLMAEGAITSDIELPIDYRRYKAAIKWYSSEANFLTAKGQLDPFKIPIEGAEVSLTGRFMIKDFSETKTWQLKVKPGLVTQEQALQKALFETETKLRDQNLDEVVVTDRVGQNENGKEIKWQKWTPGGKSSQATVIILIIGLALAFFLSKVHTDRMAEKLTQKSDNIRLEFPIFADKFSLYIACGISPDQALLKYLQANEEATPLNSELHKTLAEISNGLGVREAFLNLGKRTRIPDILKFSALIAQLIKKGDDDIQESLNKLVDELWQEKRKVVLEKGNQASTKLLLPMLILMILVVMVVLTPAYIMLSSM